MKNISIEILPDQVKQQTDFTRFKMIILFYLALKPMTQPFYVFSVAYDF